MFEMYISEFSKVNFGECDLFCILCIFQAMFEVYISEFLEVNFGEEHQETNPHILRVGWSLDSNSLQLGKSLSLTF